MLSFIIQNTIYEDTQIYLTYFISETHNIRELGVQNMATCPHIANA